MDEVGNVIEERGGKKFHLRTVKNKSEVFLAGVEGSHICNYGLHQST